MFDIEKFQMPKKGTVRRIGAVIGIVLFCGIIALGHSWAAGTSTTRSSVIKRLWKPQKVFVHTARVIKEVLPNGLTILIKPGAVNQVVSVDLYLKSGPLYETLEQRGITSMTQKILIRGSLSRTAPQIALETESAGARIGSGISGEYAYVSLSTTVDGFDKGMEIFLDLLQHPSFSAVEFEKEKKMMIENLQARGDQPFDAVYLGFASCFFEGHPLGVKTQDLIKTVQQLKRDDLKNWYRKTYQPGNMVISVVGQVNPDKLRERLKTTLGKLSRDKGLQPVAPLLQAPKENRVAYHKKELNALFMMLGYPAPGTGTKDSLVMEVINRILGGGSDGRLYMELREKQGLAYTIYSGYDKMKANSYIYAIMATTPTNFTTARDGIIREFRRLTVETVPAQTLKMAKRAIRGSYLMSHETNAAQGQILGSYELLGLGYQYDDQFTRLIEQVSAADVKRVARKYFRYYTLSVASAKELEQGLLNFQAK